MSGNIGLKLKIVRLRQANRELLEANAELLAALEGLLEDDLVHWQLDKCSIAELQMVDDAAENARAAIAKAKEAGLL